MSILDILFALSVLLAIGCAWAGLMLLFEKPAEKYVERFFNLDDHWDEPK